MRLHSAYDPTLSGSSANSVMCQEICNGIILAVEWSATRLVPSEAKLFFVWPCPVN